MPWGSFWDPKFTKNAKKAHQENRQKTTPQKITFLDALEQLFVPKKAEIRGFWMDFGCQVWSFSKLFLALKFWMVFWPFLSKKTKSAKCEKVCFVSVFAYFRKGRHVEKKAQTSPKAGQKTLIFDQKSGQNGQEKQRKMSWQQKMTRKRLLGHTFVKKKRIWMHFGIPGEAIGKALGGILGQKKGKRKHVKKRR